MSDATPTDHAADAIAGRHRGNASAEENEAAAQQQPHGKHRRPSDD